MYMFESFCSFYSNKVKKGGNCQKAFFHQQSGHSAPVCWSKNTTNIETKFLLNFYLQKKLELVFRPNTVRLINSFFLIWSLLLRRRLFYWGDIFSDHLHNAHSFTVHNGVFHTLDILTQSCMGYEVFHPICYINT